MTFKLKLPAFFTNSLQLMVIAFLVYNANLRSISSLDTYPTRFLPIGMIRELRLNLDSFPFLRKYPEWLQSHNSEEFPYYIIYTRDHFMSVYPIMPAILSIPIYAIPVMLGFTEGHGSAIGYDRIEIVATLLSKISASTAVAFSVGIIYLALLRLTSKKVAFRIALIYAFATSSWSISSQGLWQTAMSQPLLALALYFFVKGRESSKNVVYASIPLVLAVACRSTNIIFLVVFFVYLIHHKRALISLFAIFPLIIGTLLLAYNVYYFGSLMGGYSQMGEFQAGFRYPQWEAFLGLLVSPSRGMLVYSPVLFFAFAGLAQTLFFRRDPFLVYTAIATIFMILFYSTVTFWDARFSFSYRYLVDLVPGLCLLLSTIWERIFEFKLYRSLFITMIAFSIFIQIIGSFFYPCGWYDTPIKASIHQERLWDWKDPEFLRCLCAGPVTPDGLKLMQKIIPKN